MGSTRTSIVFIEGDGHEFVGEMMWAMNGVEWGSG